MSINLNEWIEREFAGYGLAMRRKEDPPIPGEPLMSMADAKELTRRAVAEFAREMSHRDEIARIIDPEAWEAIADGRNFQVGSHWENRRLFARNKADIILALIDKGAARRAVAMPSNYHDDDPRN